jgi:hypothetical protein
MTDKISILPLDDFSCNRGDMEILNIFLVIFSLLGTVLVVSSSDDSSDRKKREMDRYE